MNTIARDWRTPTVVLVASALVLSTSMGIPPRLRVLPAARVGEMGWGREVFALAIAVQNLTWGATQPFAGMIADRFGLRRACSSRHQSSTPGPRDDVACRRAP
jgi:MFS family permease